MTIINLRDFYYWYTQDEYMEVTDDAAEALRASVRYEAAYQRRLSRHKAQYSLDCDDGIEYSACLRELTPDEVLELKERFCRLWNALNSLPPAQGRRVNAGSRAATRCDVCMADCIKGLSVNRQF